MLDDCHQAVADGLQLQQPELVKLRFESQEQGVEPSHHLFGRVPSAPLREADQVGKEDRGLLDPPWFEAAGRLQFPSHVRWQQNFEQPVAALFLTPRVQQGALESQLRSDASQQQGGADRLVDVIDCTCSETAFLVVDARPRGEEQHGHIGHARKGSQPLACLVAVHARHHDVEYDGMRTLGVRDRDSARAGVGDANLEFSTQHPIRNCQIARLVVDDQHDRSVLVQLAVLHLPLSVDRRVQWGRRACEHTHIARRTHPHFISYLTHMRSTKLRDTEVALSHFGAAFR